MSYSSNPFLRRMSEKTVSDREFVPLFSPKILDQLGGNILDGSVRIFSSPPGGGKTTLLRVFSPGVLNSIWDGRKTDRESFVPLEEKGAIDAIEGPQLLGVMLSCAAGYADLPPGASMAQDGMFRALLNCRVVLKTIRSLYLFLRIDAEEAKKVQVRYSPDADDLVSIPLDISISELATWAEQLEKAVYSSLDDFSKAPEGQSINHLRFEGMLWLSAVEFYFEDKLIAPKKLLMIDDLHKLRKRQRELLLEELCEMRLGIPIWLSERSIALGKSLISQGVRGGREVEFVQLQELWGSSNKAKFFQFAQGILDRRLKSQNVIPVHTEFSRYLRDEFSPQDSRDDIAKAITSVLEELEQFESNILYEEWIREAKEKAKSGHTYEVLVELYTTRILIARQEGKSQLSLDLVPLSQDRLEELNKSDVRAAAEILLRKKYGIPYYFGADRLCSVASSNVEELLSFAAAIYDELQAKFILRKSDLSLSPQEQDRILVSAAKKRYGFIPRSHSYGTKAQRLLDAIGVFCQERTYKITASFPPGVTGFRLTHRELEGLTKEDGSFSEERKLLANILAECVAENMFLLSESAATTGRASGIVFYLSRSLCVHYKLPVGFGGWNEVKVRDLLEWLDRPPTLQSSF